MERMPKEMRFTHDGMEYKAILVDNSAPTSNTAQCIVCQQSLHDRPFYTTAPHLFDLHVDCAQQFKTVERLNPTGEAGSMSPSLYERYHIYPPHSVYCPLPHGHVPLPPSYPPSLPTPPPFPSPPPPPHIRYESRSFGPHPYCPYSYYSYPQIPHYYYPPIYNPPQLQGVQHTSGLSTILGLGALGAFYKALISSIFSPGTS